jgi:hypothetical protein
MTNIGTQNHKVQKAATPQKTKCGSGCSHDYGDGIFGMIGKYYMVIHNWVMKMTKYLFYILVGVLYPMVVHRYFIKFGQYPFFDFECTYKMAISALFAVMAFWNFIHTIPPNNPGWVEWEHFRSP